MCVYSRKRNAKVRRIASRFARTHTPNSPRSYFLKAAFIFNNFFLQSTMSHNSNKIKKMVNYPCNA